MMVQMTFQDCQRQGQNPKMVANLLTSVYKISLNGNTVITDSVNMNLSKLKESIKDGEPGTLQSRELQRLGPDWVTKQQQDFQI